MPVATTAESQSLRHQYIRAVHRARVWRQLQGCLEELRQTLLLESADPEAMASAFRDVMTELCKREGRETAMKLRLSEQLGGVFESDGAPRT